MTSPTPRNKAVWLSSYSSPLALTEIAMPTAGPGSAVVRIIGTPILPYARDIHMGKLPLLNTTPPYVPNPGAVGRVHSVGPDAVLIKEGDLVLVDSFISARDDPDVLVIQGHLAANPRSNNLLREENWRDGAFQQYLRAPLENVHVLDEGRLLRELGYTTADLANVMTYAIAAGALIEAGELQAGETVLVGPAGGFFSGAAVELALAMGANVVILGRDEAKLKALAAGFGGGSSGASMRPPVRYVAVTGDPATDVPAILAATPGGLGAHVHNDWAPTGLEGSPFLATAAAALRRGGRIVLSGGPNGNADVPYGLLVLRDLTVKGKLMGSRATMKRLVALLESGLLRVGKPAGSRVTEYPLEQFEEAIEHAARNPGWGTVSVLAPCPS